MKHEAEERKVTDQLASSTGEGRKQLSRAPDDWVLHLMTGSCTCSWSVASLKGQRGINPGGKRWIGAKEAAPEPAAPRVQDASNTASLLPRGCQLPSFLPPQSLPFALRASMRRWPSSPLLPPKASPGGPLYPRGGIGMCIFPAALPKLWRCMVPGCSRDPGWCACCCRPRSISCRPFSAPSAAVGCRCCRCACEDQAGSSLRAAPFTGCLGDPDSARWAAAAAASSAVALGEQLSARCAAATAAAAAALPDDVCLPLLRAAEWLGISCRRPCTLGAPLLQRAAINVLLIIKTCVNTLRMHSMKPQTHKRHC